MALSLQGLWPVLFILCQLNVSYCSLIWLIMQRLYKKGAIENFSKYTHVVDRPELILARVAAANLSDVSNRICNPIPSSDSLQTCLEHCCLSYHCFVHCLTIVLLFPNSHNSSSTKRPSIMRRDTTLVQRTRLSWPTAGSVPRTSVR